LQKAIVEYTPLLNKVPKARLLFELTKILYSGHCYHCFTELAKMKVLQAISPYFQNLWEKAEVTNKDFSHFLALDKIFEKKKENFSESVLLSVLVFPFLESGYWGKIENIANHIGLTNRLFDKVKHIIALQDDLEDLTDLDRAKCNQITNHFCFFDSLEFLKIRSMSNPQCKKFYRFWILYLKEILGIDPSSLKNN
jgi:tRNA nucleotidyltransferase/poly(A) polymerase